MPILHSCIKMNIIGSQLIFQITDQHICFFRCNMSCRMIFQNIPFYTNQITTHRHITGLQLHSDTGGFKYSTSFIYCRQIIAHYRHIGDFASRMKSISYRFQHTSLPHSSQHIHIGSICILQQCFSIQ